MELNEYINKKESDIKELIDSNHFKNQFGQIFSRKMKAKFNSTYDERILWGYALFLSSASVKVLENKKSTICLQGLKTAAEIFETFSLISEEYDRDYAKVLSALCYDLAGYQANAYCILKNTDYVIEESVALDKSLNHLFSMVTLLLKRELQAIRLPVLNKDSRTEKAEMEFHWNSAISNFTHYQLTGKYLEFKDEITKAIEYALYFKDATLTTILKLLDLKMKFSYERTTWTVLLDVAKENSDLWYSYLRLLATNPYANNKVISTEKRQSQVELWQSQINAVQQGVLEDNQGFIIQMPTSAGKTLIAELAILQQVGLGKKCLYIAPFRSLVNEVENTLSKNFSQLGYLVSSLSGSYEFNELDQFWFKEADVLVATPEKVDYLLRVQPQLFDEVALFVIDEGHVLGNLDNRSAQFELLLTRLKRWFIPKGSRFLFISAVMPEEDSEDFAKWLTNNEKAIINSPIQNDGEAWQPTRRLMGSFSWYGDNGQINLKNHVQSTNGKYDRIFIPNFINPITWKITRGKKKKRIIEKSFPKKDNKSEVTALLAKRYLKEGPVLIYCATVGRRGGAGVYSVLNAFLKLIDTTDEFFVEEEHFPLINDSEALEASIKWYGEDNIITKCIKRGVAPHFGDLAVEVRKAVEREYAERKLKILVATHTLGQGVNLPVKTLLVYSLDINGNPAERLSVKVRDFWNIVGRAGRAGQETEGQIVFLTLSGRDQKLFREYTNPLNSESVQSIFSVAMELYKQGRISEQTFEEMVSELSEPTLMNFLVEEVIDTPDQKLIESFIGDTLFQIQSVEHDTSLINNVLLRSANNFWAIETRERKVVFSRTGLSLKSCLSIEQELRTMESDLNDIFIKGDEELFLKVVLRCLEQCEEMIPKDALKNVHILKNPNLELFIIAWMNGDNLDTLRSLWIQSVGEEYVDLMNVYIEDCLAYRYPWGVTSVTAIALFILKADRTELNKGIINFPSKIKNGLTNQVALWSATIGINSRETCIILANNYPGSLDFNNFINWFLNLSVEEVIATGIISKYQLRNIFNIISKLGLKNGVNRSDANHSFYVKGIIYETERLEVSKDVEVGDVLLLKRQYDNEYDPYAIQVLYKDKQLGFVPRKLAKIFAFEMDVMNKTIECNVESKRGVHIKVESRYL